MKLTLSIIVVLASISLAICQPAPPFPTDPPKLTPDQVKAKEMQNGGRRTVWTESKESNKMPAFRQHPQDKPLAYPPYMTPAVLKRENSRLEKTKLKKVKPTRSPKDAATK